MQERQLRPQPRRRASPARWRTRRTSAARGRTSGQIDKAIEKLTPADVNAALRKYVKPDDFAYAFAGDFAKKK